MGELSNYSIETDQLIWLVFKDGHSLRVPVGQLSRYLVPKDLQKVRRAMKLRRDFFRQNMPKALLLLLVFGLVAAAAVTTTTVAWLARRQTPLPTAPNETEIVRNVTPQSSPSPVPSPAAGSPVATVARQRTTTQVEKPAKPSSKVATKSGGSPVSASLNAGSGTKIDGGAHIGVDTVIPTPTPVPTPSPDPTPSPSPTPVPTPPVGQVLGDSTGPDGATGTPLVP